MRFSEQIVVSPPAADAFKYIAEFENTAEWDPGIAESRKLTDGPVRVGSQFDVVALFRRKRQRFRYTVTELDDGRRIVLEGVGAKATSVDAITVDTTDSGSRISFYGRYPAQGVAPARRATAQADAREDRRGRSGGSETEARQPGVVRSQASAA